MKRVCVATLMVALISVSISFIASAQYLDSEEWRLVDLLNSYRMQNGLRPVSVSPNLTRAAEFHSNWMADRNCFSHHCSYEPDLGQRLQNANYYWQYGAAENIAAGYRNAQRTFMGWVRSESHNAAMLDSRWTAIGISRAYNSDSRYRWYWTLDFGDVVDGNIVMPETFGVALPSAQSLSNTPVNIQVFNLAGELVFESGWRNAADAQNLNFIRNRLANGVYLYTTQTQGQEGRSALKKMVVLN